MTNRANTNLKNMNVLITGIGGFLGRALSKQLLQSDAKVFGLDINATRPYLPEGIHYHQSDILNFDQLYDTLKHLRLENAIVFHLAGQSHVSKSRTDPLTTYSVNVTGTAHLLEACRLFAFNRIVFPSSALVYARPTPFPVKETDAVRANSVYASTKLACESLLNGYSADFGFVCQIARLGNIYGPGAAADSVIEIILRQVKSGGPISLKTLTPVRDFIYRDDVVSGLIALATHANESGCEIFNLSSSIPTSIREVAQTACRAGELELQITETEPRLVDNVDRLVLSTQRITDYTSWKPAWKLEDGLRQTLSELELITK